MMPAGAAILFDDALGVGRARNASDVHLQAGSPAVARIDGVLQTLDTPPLSRHDLEQIAAVLLDEQGSAALHADGDVSIARCDQRFGAMRVHCYRASTGPAIAVRLLHRQVPSLESLRLPEAVARLAAAERGLIVFAGATGSGKSTTMAAFVDAINRSRARRIVTIEDPIEYRHENRRSLVTQREVGCDTPSLSLALRGVLRADPDVVVVGEMRDGDAMCAAIAAAETGHLVLSTLHTGDASQTVERIVDAVEAQRGAQMRAALAAVVVGVVCQRLMSHGHGSGRSAIVELLIGTEAVRNLIRDARTHLLPNAIATGKQFGMQTFEQHLERLAALGEIDRQLDP